MLIGEGNAELRVPMLIALFMFFSSFKTIVGFEFVECVQSVT